MIKLEPLLADIASQYRLKPLGLHGLNHWGRVLENGLRLAETEGGDIQVIRLFAIFHDACRVNQALDPGHGARGAALAEKLLKDLSLVNRKQLDLLKRACNDHTDGKTAADITVQICWDSDRLDLARVSIMPHPDYLCTNTAKTGDLLQWANQRAMSDYSPPIIKRDWEPNFVIGE
jgi:uncharacterized protein